ncbi:hypothetical protein KP78_03190 [Jeotgalibacillus soli]|uniref:Uncharacterized protein n=1 Tax=Jeotgalibacillus soli TaxID=889306 RepID=A0A0C2SDA5_9BACL|nr:hypothetical protein KP78_03190 [Jeotgalibacillus soli]
MKSIRKGNDHMKEFDTIIHNRTVVFSDGVKKTNIAIKKTGKSQR